MDNSLDVTVKEARKNGYYLSVQENGNTTIIHSRYDPVKEATSWAKQISESHDRVLLVGGGLGYLPRAIENRGMDCAIVECLPERDLPADLPISSYTNRSSFVRFERGRRPIELIDKLSARAVQGAKILLHPGYESLLPNYESFLDSLYTLSRGKLRNVQTRYRFMSNQFNNVIETLPLVETIHPLDELNNYYAGWPGLLVGSGPSLTRDYGWIREHQKKLVVLAVDSTVSALVNQGIKPDFTISIDPQDENNVYVSNVEAEGALVASFSVSSQYFPWARGRPKFGFYLADDDEGQRLTSVVLEWLRQFISGRGSLQTGGSIATTGIDFLRLTGVDPICISGIDHCYTDHRAVAGGTRREELFVDALNRFESLPSKHLGFIYENIVQQGKELKYAQSREGETVVTMDEYEVQNHWFEQASDVLASQCLDFRADGLPMDGWTAVSSPGEYIDHHFKQSIPELNSEEFSTFEVDWESLESSVEDLLEVCPDEFSGFEATLQSADWPDHDFWTVFVRPLKDYLAMGNEPRDEVEIETYYRDLRQCLVELGRVVRQQS